MTTSSQTSPEPGQGGSPSGVGAQIRGLAEDAKHGAESLADQKKSEGADRLHGVAETVGRVADDIADESPAMAEFVRKAARGLDDVSRDLKDKSVGDLVEMARTLARREPAAFMAASAVAGFALSRLLKSSATANSSHRHAPAQSVSYGASAPGAARANSPTADASPRSNFATPVTPYAGDRPSTVEAVPTSSTVADAPVRTGADTSTAVTDGRPALAKLEEKGSAI